MLLSGIGIIVLDWVFLYVYSWTCLMRPLKIDKTKALKPYGSLMHAKRIVECSRTFVLHQTIIGLENLLGGLWVAA